MKKKDFDPSVLSAQKGRVDYFCKLLRGGKKKCMERCEVIILVWGMGVLVPFRIFLFLLFWFLT